MAKCAVSSRPLDRWRYAFAGTRTLLLGGAFTGFLSGLVGSAGLGVTVFLSLGFPPVAYFASEATTALALHAAKMVAYQRRLSLAADVWALALLLGMAMMLGTCASRRLIDRMAPDRFRRAVTVLFAVIALEMIIFG